MVVPVVWEVEKIFVQLKWWKNEEVNLF